MDQKSRSQHDITYQREENAILQARISKTKHGVKVSRGIV